MDKALDSQDVRIITTTTADPDKVILLNTDNLFEPSYIVSNKTEIGSFPVRSELAILPADESGKVIGWTVTETIGMAAINTNAVNRLTLLPEVYSWPLPGRGTVRLQVVFGNGKLQLRRTAPIHVTRYLWEYGSNGFENINKMTFDKLPGKNDAERLCQLTCDAEVMKINGPPLEKIINDSFWQNVIDELPDLLMMAEIMLS